ncbi:MAG: sugar phosphate isomerase/epimerase [Deltaproteobacteria bacterium]|nr:sugar phosphate isomerase/epimerase [Deltaproteobacteria bacterium]
MKIGFMNNPSASVYDEIVSFGEFQSDFLDLTIEGPKALDLDVDRVRDLLDQYDLSVVGHTDPCLPYAYPVSGIRKACFEELQRCAKIFSALGATIMNIHPCYACPPNAKHDLVKLNIDALKPIARMAKSFGLTLVYENFTAPFDSVSTYEALLSEIPDLAVHLDFGHANMGRDSGETFCKCFKGSIKHVHFSDNRSTADHHMPIGVGNIDWKEAISALKSIGYDGTITLEVFCNDRTVLFQYLEVSRKYVLELWKQVR